MNEDISVSVDAAYKFFRGRRCHVFCILPHIKKKKIQVYVKTARGRVLGALKQLGHKTGHKIDCKSLKTLEEYLQNMQESALVSREFMNPVEPSPYFYRIRNLLVNNLGEKGDLYWDVYIRRNNKQITKMDFIFKSRTGSALFAVQEVKGERIERNIRRKHNKLERTFAFERDLYNYRPWKFRVVVHDSKIDFYRVYQDNNEKLYPLENIGNCVKFFK